MPQRVFHTKVDGVVRYYHLNINSRELPVPDHGIARPHLETVTFKSTFLVKAKIILEAKCIQQEYYSPVQYGRVCAFAEDFQHLHLANSTQGLT